VTDARNIRQREISAGQSDLFHIRVRMIDIAEPKHDSIDKTSADLN
jgi:hypothetical protein